MKRNRRKIFVILMIFCMTFTMMPSLAFAEESEVETPALSAEAESTDTSDPLQAEPAEEQTPTKDQTKEPAKDQTEKQTENQAEETAEGAELVIEEPAQKKMTPLLKSAPVLRAGNSINFQSYVQAGCRQFWSTGGEGYVGTCCQPGVPGDSSGTATMSKYSNTSLTAKLAYQYGYKLNWIRSYAVLDGFQNLTNAARFMYMIQISQVGVNQWNRWAADNNFSQRVRDNVIACYNSAASVVASLNVPDGFECYLCYPASGNQRFILYRYVEPPKTGYAKVVKTSGAPGAISSLSGYTLAGAEYQVYTNADCTTKASTVSGSNALFTTNASGDSQVLELNVGNYWLKETANPNGYAISQTKTAFSVTTSNTTQAGAVVINVTDTPLYGRPNLRVFKVGDTENFNPTTLNGAEFTINYYDVDDKADIASAEPMRTWKFTTKQKAAPQGSDKTSLAAFDWMADRPVEGSDEFYEDDNGNRVMPLGWFTIEETVAPPGYKLNSTKIYGQIKLASDGQSATTVIDGAKADAKLGMDTVTVSDKANTVTISKKNSATGSELAGAKLQILKGSTVVVPTWTTTTTPKVITGLEPDTYTLREIEAPYGYDLANDVTFTVDGTSDQTVTMTNTPVTVKTTAVDAATKKHVGSRKTSSKITDTVHMTGLVKGRKYRLTGVLMNKRTGQAVPNVTVSPKEFTATGATMDVSMDFTFNSASLGEGDSVVVYETLYRTSKVHSDETVIPKEIQKHQDINDKDQTITYPSISTTAVDQTTGTKNMLAASNAVIKDTVSYKGLVTGETCTLEGELFDKTTNRLTGIKSTASLTPTSASGTTKITFTLDASGLENHTLVVYETLKLNGETLTEHKNPNDTAQTIYIPEVRTTLTDKDNKNHVSNADSSVTLNDSVVCSNLIVGKTYTISGKLVYKDSGNDVLDNGSTVKATKTFTAASTTETQTLTFTFNGSALEGKTVVAFEDLYTENKKVGTHADLSDEDQSVHIPKVRTTALDSETNDHISLGDKSVTIKDTVSYENLIPGKTYTLTGTLMDKATGNAVSGVTTEPVQFKPTSAKGTAVVTFVFNGTNLKNHKAVAYEKLYLGTEVKDANLIGVHEDIDDKDQTVNIPEAATTLLDSETKDHIAFGDNSVTLIDTVAYKNLLVGKEYVAKGTLMNQKTGEAVKVNGEDVTAETTFTAAAENGTVEVKFVFNGKNLPGETVVAFETIEYKNVPVAIHANLNDKAQTVPIPKIRTTAAISDDNHVFTDTINYENLLPDRKYVFRGWLVDTATGTKIAGSDGKVDLTATDANINGSVQMEMNTAEYDNMYGHSMTAYEELYVIEKKDGKDTEIKVAEHKDRSGDQSTNPQIVEIYHDLKVQKNVTGNLGDLTKIFEYTVEFTDLVPNKEYKVEGDDAKTFKAGADGKATLELKLADDQEAVIKQLPKSATYVVTEAASDHIAQYKMFSEDMEKKGAKIVTKEANNGAEAAKILATAKETVDLFDGTIVVLWENNRDIATLTGVQTYLGIWAGALALVLFGIATILVRRRKYSSAE